MTATRLKYTFCIFTMLNFFPGSMMAEIENATEKFNEAYVIAKDVLSDFFELFQACMESTMANQNFIIDDLQSYLFYPAKTTVGYAPKFTSNRRFFANLIGTPEFHHMMDKDLVKLKENYIRKLKACDVIVMDEHLLDDMLDRAYETSMI
ncbi:uncharacterized protein LOC133520527 [Cydia pomonella]|uniref:uncharacterized protein LOC133520527 n=1 Tax=Cydia pomonella TaxID=82600 RepID=UPI002ADE0AA0|nr:uncharacterized protein LOC133520527 [Cydia pomonella]